VLVDSESIHVRVESELIGELGWELTPEEVAERFLGRTDAEMHAEIAAHLGEPLPSGWSARLGDRKGRAFERELRPVDGIVEALDGITIATCVASNGTHEAIKLALSVTGLADQFQDRIFSATDVLRGKPAPDLFLHAADAMGVDPSACAVVEDSPFGVEAARAAGMTAFAYSGGVMPADRLDRAHVVFDDMRELPRLLACSHF
jgi:HAD superfamily hydrolase (TIGR01509 family)